MTTRATGARDEVRRTPHAGARARAGARRRRRRRWKRRRRRRRRRLTEAAPGWYDPGRRADGVVNRSSEVSSFQSRGFSPPCLLAPSRLTGRERARPVPMGRVSSGAKPVPSAAAPSCRLCDKPADSEEDDLVDISCQRSGCDGAPPASRLPRTTPLSGRTARLSGSPRRLGLRGTHLLRRLTPDRACLPGATRYHAGAKAQRANSAPRNSRLLPRPPRRQTAC